VEYFTFLLHHHYYCFHYITHGYLFWFFGKSCRCVEKHTTREYRYLFCAWPHFNMLSLRKQVYLFTNINTERPKLSHQQLW